MSDKKFDLPKWFIIFPLLIALGLIYGGYFISETILKGKEKDRVVTVKGLSEREVVADTAIWPITVKVSGDDVTVINKTMQENIETIKAFLLNYGIQSSEIELYDFRVTSNIGINDPNNKYTITTVVLIKTKNIEIVKKASEAQHVLAAKGIVFSGKNDYDAGGPMYEYTGFNNIKSEMLSEAIRSARTAAEQFAKDANCSIGKLKKANQGSFVITSPVGSGTGGDNGYSSDMEQKKSIRKNIRAVVTLEFEIN